MASHANTLAFAAHLAAPGPTDASAAAVRALAQPVAGALDALGPDSGFDPTYYQQERYLGGGHRSPALTAYYTVKPLIPRRLQLDARRLYARRQARPSFPGWPVEPVLAERAHERMLAAMDRDGVDRIPTIGWWPAPWRCACVLTHDIEGPAGLERIDRIVELEQRHGLRSLWNFVAEDYPIPHGTFERLRERGCEIGLHGVRHDGKLFQSRQRFMRELPKIHRYLERWDAVGFRSPATHRRAEWMRELGCLYDSSYPDTDPFEPQPGGCCSVLPFMLGEVVELPITLVQDHTLWEVLRRPSIDLWLEKIDWIVANHGLINVNTHPDYLTSSGRLDSYERLLASVAALERCWHALPREVASWWRTRTRTRGPGEAPIWWVRRSGGRVVVEP